MSSLAPIPTDFWLDAYPSLPAFGLQVSPGWRQFNVPANWDEALASIDSKFGPLVRNEVPSPPTYETASGLKIEATLPAHFLVKYEPVPNPTLQSKRIPGTTALKWPDANEGMPNVIDWLDFSESTQMCYEAFKLLSESVLAEAGDRIEVLGFPVSFEIGESKKYPPSLVRWVEQHFLTDLGHKDLESQFRRAVLLPSGHEYLISCLIIEIKFHPLQDKTVCNFDFQYRFPPGSGRPARPTSGAMELLDQLIGVACKSIQNLALSGDLGINESSRGDV